MLPTYRSDAGNAASTAAVPASAQTYSKCQTLQGNIIIVAGTTCPTGTFWVGYY